MADRIVTLRLTADGRLLSSAVRQAGDDLDRFGNRARGAGRQAEDALQDVDQRVQGLKATLAGLATAFGAVLGIAAVQKLAETSDAYANLSSKIRLVTDSENEMVAIRSKVVAIANDTFQAVEATANLYSRLTNSTRALGLAESQRLQITETINQAMVVSGANAVEASAAIIQLSQGLASGTLRGEEFNSVAEQAPILLQLLQDSLGVTRGELRKMAADGKLTAEILTTAFLEGAEGVDAQFQSIETTIGNAVQQFKNSFLIYVGETNAAIGASTGLVNVIQFAARNMETLATGVLLLGAALTTKLVVGMVAATAATSAKLAANAALARSELIAAAAATTAATAEVRQAQAMFLAGGSAANLTLAMNALAVAEARATVAIQANTLAALANQGALARTGATLLSFVGGAVGAAILGIGGLVYWLSTMGDETQKIIDDLGKLGNQLSDTAERSRDMADGLREASDVRLGEGFEQFAKNAALMQEATEQLRKSQEELLAISAIEGIASAITGEESERVSVLNEKIQQTTRELESLQGATGDVAQALAGRLQPAVAAAGVAFGELFNNNGSAFAFFDDVVAGIDSVQAALDRLFAADKALPGLLSKIEDGLKSSTEELEKATNSTSQLAQKTIDLALAEAEVVGNGELIKSIREKGAAWLANIKATEAAKRSTTGVSQAQREAARATKDLDKGIKDAAKTITDLIDAQRAFRDQSAMMAAELAGPIAEANEQYVQDVQALQREQTKLSLTTEDYTERLRVLTEAKDRDIEATQRQAEEDRKRADVVGRMLEEIQDEIDLVGLSTEARERESAVMQASRELGRALGAEEAEQLREKIRLLQQAERSANFDFAKSFNSALSRAFETGSLTQGFRQFMDDFEGAFTGSIESALGAVNSVLNFAAPVVDAYRNSDGNKVGAGLRAVNQQLAASGNIFAQIASTIDSLFGGRLFGTDYETQSSGFTANLSGSGVSGTQFENQSRQRSLFRGTARRTLTDDLDQSAIQALEDFFDKVTDVMALAARDLGVSVPNFIEGAFKEVTDANGKIIEQFGTIMGRQFQETFEEFQQRVLAENVLAVIDQLFRRTVGSNATTPGEIIPGIGGDSGGIGGGNRADPNPRFSAIKSVQAYEGEASAIAERWRADAETLLDGAQFLLAAAINIRDGIGLLGDEGGLTAIADLIEDLQQPGESLQETFARVTQAATLLDQATDLMGISLEGTREAFVRAAADIADAAGGIDNANALWNTYFNTFYSDAERASLALAQAESDRNAQLEALGLSAAVSAADFRAAFEANFPTLTAEQRVQWLEAASAIAGADAAQAAYNETLAESTREAERAAAALSGLLGELNQIGASIEEQFTALARSGLSEFEQQMLTIDDNLQGNVRNLLALRRSLVQSGASAEELAEVERLLARAHELAAAQAAQAIGVLRDAGRSLVDQLYGETAEAVDGFAQQGIDAFGAIGDAASDVYADQLRSIKSVQDYLDSQLLGDLTSLTGAEQFAEAQRQFDAAIAAQDGQNATRLADILLGFGRDRFAGGPQFAELEASIRAALTGLLGIAPGEPVTGVTGPGTGFGNTIDTAVTDFGAQAENNRLELASQLAEIVRNLLSATGESLETVADSIGLNLSDLVADLGVNLSDLTVSSTGALAQIAGTLGVELTDLARSVGVDLGALADDQSLLNDALEAQIAKLPEDQAARLQPLLDAVEEAAATGGPDKINEAIEALEAETRLIGGRAAAALAPFLDGVDPDDPLIAIDGILRAGFEDSVYLLGEINAAVRDLIAVAAGEGLPGGGGGTGGTGTPGGGIPVDPITPPSAPSSRAMAGGFERGRDMSGSELLAELKALRLEVTELRRATERGDAANVQATKDAGREQARATEAQTLVMKSSRNLMK